MIAKCSWGYKVRANGAHHTLIRQMSQGVQWWRYNTCPVHLASFSAFVFAFNFHLKRLEMPVFRAAHRVKDVTIHRMCAYWHKTH